MLNSLWLSWRISAVWSKIYDTQLCSYQRSGPETLGPNAITSPQCSLHPITLTHECYLSLPHSLTPSISQFINPPLPHSRSLPPLSIYLSVSLKVKRGEKDIPKRLRCLWSRNSGPHITILPNKGRNPIEIVPKQKTSKYKPRTYSEMTWYWPKPKQLWTRKTQDDLFGKMIKYVCNTRGANTHFIKKNVRLLIQISIIPAFISRAVTPQIKKVDAAKNVKHSLFKVWLNCGKAGVGILSQHTLSMLEFYCGCWGGFATPAFEMWCLEGAGKVMQEPDFSAFFFSFWQILCNKR